MLLLNNAIYENRRKYVAFGKFFSRICATVLLVKISVILYVAG